MPRVIRPELSKKNKYYVPRNRYFELKYFCLQYKDYQRAYNELCTAISSGIVKIQKRDGAYSEDQSFYIREVYLDKMNLIEDVSRMTDPVFGDYIFKAVTEGLTYQHFKTKDRIPCGRDYYYELYRKFFYILDHKKDFA